ncbi:ATP-dependent DNA helicase [Trichonephila clavata]|uniref:ATP-dependent DNA helicase n=1 Tax=Trichonephila clavata TaxID=2740835 RepID=A0A8X6LFM9_TRICU|nr:ATP-dependent DNA helicase [Trichonephila clavata]
MLTFNIDTADGLVNGAVGQLKKLEYCFFKGSINLEGKSIGLEFPNSNDIGKEKRRQCICYSIQNKMGLLWTTIERVKKVVYRSNNDAISVTRNQFPIILAEAMTIHKSQEAAVAFKRNRSLQYVALSRVASIQGLSILGEYKAPPREDDLILQEMKRLKAHTILPKYAFLHQHNDPNTLQIMYHNVQSLNAHHKDIAADPCMMNSNILLFAETWTKVGDKFAFDPFDHYHLLSHHSRRKPSGVPIYIKKHLSCMVEEVEMFPNYETGVHVMVVNFKTKIRIAVLYAKPGSYNNDIYDALDQILDNKNSDDRTVLAGDFKIDRMTRRGREFCEMLTNMYYITLRNIPSQYTTIGQTTIDCVFSTYGLRTWGVFESGLSTHLPLHVQMPWGKKSFEHPIHRKMMIQV